MFCECDDPSWQGHTISTVDLPADARVIEGYYYNSKFYYDSAHTKEIKPLNDSFYVDITTASSPKLYFYSQSKYNKSSGGGGTDDYNDLENQPQIESVTLVGNKTASQLGLVAKTNGSMTGTTTAENITVSGDLTADSIDVETSITVPTPSDNTDAANKGYVDTGLAAKANQATTYTKTEVDTSLTLKADKSDTYTKSEVDAAVATKVSDVRVNGTSVTSSGVANVTTVDNVTSASSLEPLAAKQGKLLNDRINNLENIGRFLALWNSATGLPTTNPTTMPYAYKTGDYYRVSNVDTTTNYEPTGSSYDGTASSVVETSTVEVGSIYYYDGTSWNLQASGGGGTVQDVQVNGTSILSGGVANLPLYTTTGTNTDGPMTQNAVTSMVFANNDTNKIVIGSSYRPSNDGIYIGDINTGWVGGANAIAIGKDSGAGGISSVAIGPGSLTSKQGRWQTNINGNQCNGDGSVAIGFLANVGTTGAYSTSIGYNASLSANNTYSVALGAQSLTTNAGEVSIGGSNLGTNGYNSTQYRLLTNVYDPQTAHDAATKGYVDGATESYTVASTDWVSLSGAAPYTYSTEITATHTIGSNTVVALLNDQASLFATYGFAVAAVSGQNLELYSIGQPSANVTLKINYKG